MAKAIYYPPANRTAQYWENDFDRATMDPMEKVLLHTTETAGWPAYGGGAKAPTLTYNPWVAPSLRWRQHNKLNTSARALQDPTSTPVRENRDGVVQVEIICYCDPKLYARYGKGVNALPASAYEDLGAFLAFMNNEWGVPLVRAPQWSTYPPPNSIRMSSATYNAFKGVLGHQHASGNTHGDPGMTNAQVDRILAVAKRIITPVAPTPPTGGTMALTLDDKNWIEGRLQAYASFLVLNREQTTERDLDAIQAKLAEIDATVDRIEDDTDDGTVTP